MNNDSNDQKNSSELRQAVTVGALLLVVLSSLSLPLMKDLSAILTSIFVVVLISSGLPAFLFLFTGEFKYEKFLWAIRLSYCIAVVFLLVPLLLPALLDGEKGLGRPVGVVKVAGAEMNAKKLTLNQWSLNIGGIPFAVEEQSNVLQQPSSTPEAEQGPAEVKSKEDYDSKVDTSVHKSEEDQPSTEGTRPHDFKGGLVIPLYVLTLAILGGTINMTRRLPELQLDIVNTIYRNADHNALSKGDRRKLAKFRRDLIQQYMYLLTAPFLAIVAYHLLFLIETNLAERVPVVVLISFASGLYSEAVLQRVIEKVDVLTGSRNNQDKGNLARALG